MSRCSLTLHPKVFAALKAYSDETGLSMGSVVERLAQGRVAYAVPVSKSLQCDLTNAARARRVPIGEVLDRAITAALDREGCCP